MLIDVQFNPAANSWPKLRDAVLQAEADGYDTTWIFDHFDGSMLDGGADMLECFTLLGALAATTTTIGLGTLVVNVANRHPAVLAAAASSAHRISGGRLTLGLGAGTAPGSKWAHEHTLLDIPLWPNMADRHRAVTAQIDLLRSLWGANDDSEYRNFALALPHPPIIVGVNSVGLARLAGRLADGVNVRLDHPRAGEFIDAARAAAGPREFEVSAWAFGAADESRDAAIALGCHRLIEVQLGTLP